MAEVVLDASALLAFLCEEAGAEEVAAVLTRPCISAANLAETIRKMVEYGKPLDEVCYQIEWLRIPAIAFDGEQAKIAASLWKATRAVGLSLGDRACLALGLKAGATVLFTERAWSKAGVGVSVSVIR